jgi:hypothetical protein
LEEYIVSLLPFAATGPPDRDRSAIGQAMIWPIVVDNNRPDHGLADR